MKLDLSGKQEAVAMLVLEVQVERPRPETRQRVH
jgi:hypothetical protein